MLVVVLLVLAIDKDVVKIGDAKHIEAFA